MGTHKKKTAHRCGNCGAVHTDKTLIPQIDSLDVAVDVACK